MFVICLTLSSISLSLSASVKFNLAMLCTISVIIKLSKSGKLIEPVSVDIYNPGLLTSLKISFTGPRNLSPMAGSGAGAGPNLVMKRW